MVKQAFILLAGEGTRLRPLTNDKPKCLLEVGGRSVLEWQWRWLQFYGIREFVLNPRHHAAQIRDSLYRLRSPDVTSPWASLVPTEKMLGTAQWLWENRDILDETFIVVYGDVLSDVDLGRVLAAHQAKDSAHVSVVCQEHELLSRCGIIIPQQGFIEAVAEKRAVLNSGIFVIDRNALENVEEICPDLLKQWNAQVIIADPQDTILEISTHDSYAAAQKAWPTQRAKEWIQ